MDESTALLASGESTPRSPDAAKVQRRSSLQELSRLMTAEDKAEEALLAAQAAILFKVAGLPGPDYYSIHALRALVYLGSCARGARDPPLSQGSIPGAEPPHPPGAPRNRHMWSHRHTYHV